MDGGPEPGDGRARTGERVLACSIGLAPQVVTETLWALGIGRSPPWTPTRIALLTTGAGAAMARERLLDPRDGAIAALGRAYRRPDLAALAERVSLEVITDEELNPAQDMTAEREIESLSAAALRFVRDLTAPREGELHLSIAGGRKSMSALLAIAMTLCARPGDRMSHVTVGAATLADPNRFFPQPGEAGDVTLSLLPFPRLRAVAGVALEAPTLAAVVAETQRRLDPPPCRIDLTGRALVVGDRVVPAQPIVLAFAAALAADAAAGGDGLPRAGLTGRLVATHHARIVGPGRSRLRDVLDAEQVEEWASRLNKLVAGCPAWPRDRRFVERAGPWAQGRYRINLPPELITLA